MAPSSLQGLALAALLLASSSSPPLAASAFRSGPRSTSSSAAAAARTHRNDDASSSPRTTLASSSARRLEAAAVAASSSSSSSSSTALMMAHFYPPPHADRWDPFFPEMPPMMMPPRYHRQQRRRPYPPLYNVRPPSSRHYGHHGHGHGYGHNNDGYGHSRGPLTAPIRHAAYGGYAPPPPPPRYGGYGYGYGYAPPPPPARYSVVLDADASEVIDEADELIEELREEEEWMTDAQRAKMNRGNDDGEVVDIGDGGGRRRRQPTKSANNAAYTNPPASDNEFQGRKPGQAVNAGENGSRPNGSEKNDNMDDFAERRANSGKDTDGFATDPREQHVVLDDYEEYANDFFRPPRPPPGRPPPSRAGPSVYTPEEEELIAEMGGMGGGGPRSSPPPLSTPSMPDGSIPVDPMLLDGGRLVPSGGPSMREGGYLGDSTLREISHDHSVPIPYLADVLANWGAPVPIDPNALLGDVVTGEQAFALLEAIHTLDVAALHDRYAEDDLMSICDYYEIDMKAAFDFCVGRGWALPFGVRTFLRVEQEEEMLDALGGDVMY